MQSSDMGPLVLMFVFLLIFGFVVYNELRKRKRQERDQKAQLDAKNWFFAHIDLALEQIDRARTTIRHPDVLPYLRHDIESAERALRDLKKLQASDPVDWVIKRESLTRANDQFRFAMQQIRDHIAALAHAKREAPLLQERIRRKLETVNDRIALAKRSSPGAKRLLVSARARFEQASDLLKESSDAIDWLSVLQLLQSSEREVSLSESTQTSAETSHSSHHSYAHSDSYGGHSSHHDSGHHDSGGYGGGGGGDSGGGGGGGGSD